MRFDEAIDPEEVLKRLLEKEQKEEKEYVPEYLVPEILVNTEEEKVDVESSVLEKGVIDEATAIMEEERKKENPLEDKVKEFQENLAKQGEEAKPKDYFGLAQDVPSVAYSSDQAATPKYEPQRVHEFQGKKEDEEEEDRRRALL